MTAKTLFALGCTATLVIGGAVGAAEPPAPIYQLSPAEKEAAIASAVPDTGTPVSKTDGLVRGIHGEVAVEIGNGGQRGVSVATVAPLGDDGFVALSAVSQQFGRRHQRTVR